MSQSSKNIDGDEDWSRISELLLRIATFKNKSIDKWQRKTHADEEISNCCIWFLRGTTLQREETQSDAGAHADGDPELLDDSEFYQQLLKELFGTIDPVTSETSFYSLKKLHAKKRKIVDRRASNCRRYNVYEKIVNFMAPETTAVSPMLPDLNNLFGLKKQKPASVV